MEYETFNENLMTLLPYWHYKVDRPFKQSHTDKMSLETYYCLEMLNRYGAMTMSDLVKHLRITKQQATKLINKLYQCHFVNRLDDQEDRRLVRIEVTPAALEYIEKNIHRDQAFVKSVEAKVGREGVEELNQAMEILLRILPKLD